MSTLVPPGPIEATAAPASPSPTGIQRPTGRETAAQQITRLEGWVQADPSDGPAYRDLGLALLQRVRETGDPSLYDRADESLKRARNLLPDDPLVLIGVGTLQLARHQFRDALETGREALRIEAHLPEALAVEVDAYVELGRYSEAATTLQSMVDMKPGLASYARISYLRELHGDIPGALEAMELATSGDSGVPENDAYLLVLLAHLETLAGHRANADTALERALALVPDFPAALAAQGRAAVADRDYTTAIDRFTRAAAIIPLPEYVIALGEAQEASGDVVAAAKSYDLARAETRLFQASGVVVDLELSIFESDHGDAAVALDLARAAYGERATIKTADALAWALFRNGRIADARRFSREALRLGTKDPLLLFHAGAILAASHHDAEAKRDLEAALRLDAGFSATGAAKARALLAQLR